MEQCAQKIFPKDQANYSSTFSFFTTVLFPFMPSNPKYSEFIDNI